MGSAQRGSSHPSAPDVSSLRPLAVPEQQGNHICRARWASHALSYNVNINARRRGACDSRTRGPRVQHARRTRARRRTRAPGRAGTAAERASHGFRPPGVLPSIRREFSTLARSPSWLGEFVNAHSSAHLAGRAAGWSIEVDTGHVNAHSVDRSSCFCFAPDGPSCASRRQS